MRSLSASTVACCGAREERELRSGGAAADLLERFRRFRRQERKGRGGCANALEHITTGGGGGTWVLILIVHVHCLLSCNHIHGTPRARRFVQRFDDRDAAPAFVTIAARRPSRLDRVHQIFDNWLMPARVADDRRRRGLGVLVAVLGRHGRGHFRRRVAHVTADDAILLDAHGPACTRHFHPPRIPRIFAVVASSVPIAPLANSSHPTIVSSTSIWCTSVPRSGRHAHDVAEPPQQKIDGVNALVNQGAATVERARAAPFRLRVGTQVDDTT